MGIITNPLPLRTCSRCVNWYRNNATPDETGRQRALCCVLNERKYGSEGCERWKREE